MLFKILRLFGLDVPAKIEAVKAGFEEGVEQATDHVKQVAQEAAIIAAFSLVATVTASLAVGVGLMAIYRWLAQDYGPYVGFATDGGLLLAMAGVCATAAAIKVNALAGHRAKSPVRVAETPAVIEPEPRGLASPDELPFNASSSSSMVSAAPTATATDLMEPLSAIVSTYLKSRSNGNPIVDGLIGNLGATTHSTASEAANEALERAANVVRHGDMTNVIVVLTGATVMGWMLSRFPKADVR
jgi:predicted transcriptional regulator